MQILKHIFGANGSIIHEVWFVDSWVKMWIPLKETKKKHQIPMDVFFCQILRTPLNPMKLSC